MEKNHAEFGNRFTYALRVAGLGAMALMSGLAVTGCQPEVSGLPGETILASSSNGDVDITAREYDIVVSSANRWKINPDQFGKLGLCESSLNENAKSGGHYNFYQQGKKYWNKRVDLYNRVTGENISTDIRDPRSVSLVSAKMIHDAQNSPKARKVRGLPSDWVQCQRGWDGRDNKSKYWDAAKQHLVLINAKNTTEYLSQLVTK